MFIGGLHNTAFGVVRRNTSQVTFERLNEFLVDEPILDDYPAWLVEHPQAPFVDLQQVSVYNDDGQLLYHIDQLTIDEPGIYRISGANGTGKTTLLKLLLNSHHSNGLKIQADGHLRMNQHLANTAGFCGTPYVFVSGSVQDNILLEQSPPAHYQQVLDALQINQELLAKSVQPEQVTLSLGEQAKVALA